MRSQPRWRSCRHSLADLSRLPVRFDPVEQPARTTHGRPQILDAGRESAVRGHDGDHPARSRRTERPPRRSCRRPRRRACTTSTGPVRPSATPPRARPSSTRTTCERETGRGDEAVVQPSGRAGSVLPPAVGSGSDDVRAVDHQHLGAGRGGRGGRVGSGSSIRPVDHPHSRDVRLRLSGVQERGLAGCPQPGGRPERHPQISDEGVRNRGRRPQGEDVRLRRIIVTLLGRGDAGGGRGTGSGRGRQHPRHRSVAAHRCGPGGRRLRPTRPAVERRSSWCRPGGASGGGRARRCRRSGELRQSAGRSRVWWSSITARCGRRTSRWTRWPRSATRSRPAP